MMKYFHFLAGAGIMIGIFIILFSLYKTLYPPRIITFTDKTIKVDKRVYKPGDTIDLKVNYCKETDVQGLHTIELINDVILPLYSVERRFLPTGCHTAVYPIVLVAVTPPGKYHISLHIEYQIPYFFFYGSKQTYSIDSDEFIVERAEPL